MRYTVDVWVIPDDEEPSEECCGFYETIIVEADSVSEIHDSVMSEVSDYIYNHCQFEAVHAIDENGKEYNL